MILNLLMNSHRSLASLSKSLFCAATLAAIAVPAFANDKKAPPPKPANQYAAFDTHPDEHVTIAAEPCTDSHDCPFFRLPYIQHSLLPVRVIITNDSDTAVTLEEVRIQFISATKDVIPAATLEDINRRLFNSHSAAYGTKIPLTNIPIHHAPVDKKIIQDDDDFGFKGTTVNPHSTLAGYLFYDIKELDDPALKGAQLYLKMIYTLDRKKQLFAFTIPFDKWLAANPDNSQKTSAKN